MKPLPHLDNLLFKDEVYALVGAAMDVHRELGNGFLEAVYQEALEMELTLRKIPFRSQVELHIPYKGAYLKKRYIADLVAFDEILVELKAISVLTSVEEAQVIHYIKASNLPLGVLINFGASSLQFKRMVFTSKENSSNS